MTLNFLDRPGGLNSTSVLLKRVAEKLRVPVPRALIVAVDQRIAATNFQAPSEGLRQIVQAAWDAGQQFDLNDVGYGPSHWANESFHADPFPYYNFLAGFVRSQNCKRIFEVGTHFGGSTNSMLRGVADPTSAKVVTVDITDLNPAIRQTAGITKVIGDANSEGVIKLAVAEMGSEPIDLLYVDAAHDFTPTAINIGLYTFLLRPRFVIIDDIILNDGMRELWNVIKVAHGSHAINCIDVVPEIRSPKVGFGLLQMGR